ncbi:Acetylornithine deacetylase/Succinyl-diaminopimelate desuccinylase [Nakamurella panacisegetis]|uniref:Acetylornithine deacetylase/Succinyl-diaminopimelate desuccinylase n=1 Tax=Nakamurella panacisegetis TaxID=1090615 RepID=A0A1H0HRF0_9ACTN|nr:M20/M25/M40 family metallo-hydrolase [Nakamurella panacisegetis]SDO21391.1 Acetylornithine deacetylase/Succinyl-diaminopimelate desuccinylase [Nakamurella panacisegetis]
MTSERDVVQAGAAQWLDTLQDWVRIPSVSADPGHHGDVTASAEFLAEQLRANGFPDVKVLADGPWLPAVLAHWPSGDPDAVRVVVYGHHDVQPADGVERWTYPPFEPRIIDGVLHGRGASDDKGNIAMHLLGLRAHLAATGRTSPAVNLTLLVEGEEESGSPHIMELLHAYRDELAADLIVVSDTGIFGPETPSVCIGMRGLVAAEIHVHGPDIDLHSGSFGGAVPNPITELSRILAALHDDDRHVTVPGFYDDVIEPTEAERAATAALPFDEEAWITGPAASRAAAGEAGWTTLERIGARPTAEINGIWGGYTGPGNKTIVPTDAYAKVTFRLVGRQQPAVIQQQVTDFVTAAARPGVQVEIHWEGAGVAPLYVDTEHPATTATRAALGQAFDTDVVLMTREGGSGPEAELAGVIGAPLVFLGVMTDDDQIHAPNEKAVVSLLLKGCEAVAHLWRELAERGRAGLR